MLGDFDAIRPKKKKNYGVRCGQAVLPDSNSASNIRWTDTTSTFIDPPQSFQSRWMDFTTDCRNNDCMMWNGNSFSPPGESRNCVSGTINGEKIAMVFCWKFGTLCIAEPGAWQ